MTDTQLRATLPGVAARAGFVSRLNEERAAFDRRAQRERVSLALGRVGMGILLVVLWQVVSVVWDLDFWISRPTNVWEQLGEWRRTGDLSAGIRATGTAAGFGFVFGVVSGATAGFALGRMRLVGRLLEPFVLLAYSVPKIALTPLFVLTFGIGIDSKIALTTLVIFFYVFFPTYEGTLHIDQQLVQMSRLMAASRAQTWRTVIIPQSAVWTFTGIRMALPHAITATVLGEIIASTEGIGHLIHISASFLNPDGVWAGIVVLLAMVLALELLVQLVQRKLMPWDRTRRRLGIGG